MQEAHDEGIERAPAAAADQSGRLDASAYEVELLGGGWSGVIGSGRVSGHVRGLCVGRIVWNMIELHELVLCQAAGILVVQGKPIQDFFPPDTRLVRADNQDLVCYGPFFFLKGTLSRPADPPMRLKNVVLGRVFSAPEDLSMEAVRGKLLEQVL
jgi:hypothetical protein